MTGTNAIFWPMIAHVALVFGLYVLLSIRRRRAVLAGRATTAQFRENRVEPDESLFARNSLASQFELPVLFYACSFATYLVDADSLPAIALAWIFVLSRWVHAAIHVTNNRIRYRSPAFAFGFLALGAMWAWLAVWMILD
ncbi:MAPEG family protein [Rhizobiaceae bacterium n13]|uniref:MAPEG family protein n=1 Tax=Ferirhizobium litorale TaxID=2927786 RepID=A0AAE3U351_9HYPH|nr:MAPEG family protein [Fererhizobium litorale]MDI7864821.1 MAPEG family protein [Fererhizobium litorale]MDI7921734.1 MAPEG family protein [Fererhizobium litorale]